jgi:hypothetical protein
MKPAHSLTLALVLALTSALTPPAVAQERLVASNAAIVQKLGTAYVVPHVGVTRRADFLLRTLYVSCDTREAQARADELRRTLTGMLAAAERDQQIELSRFVQIDSNAYSYGAGVGDDTIVVPFTEEEIQGPMLEGYGGRSDTSYVTLLVKTPISESDTLAAAVARIESFVEGVDRVGRSALDLDPTDSLSVVDPGQYRDEIFAAMSEDANARIAALGTVYAARFEGLENQVSWYRSDVLDLTLFIPHKLAVVPAAPAS